LSGRARPPLSDAVPPYEHRWQGVSGGDEIGTVASLGAVVQSQGWSLDAVLVVLAGTGLTFGL
jgi:hypothetical protein